MNAGRWVKECRVIHYVYGPDMALAYFALVGGLLELICGADTSMSVFTYAGIVFLCIAALILLHVMYKHVSSNIRVHGHVWWYHR